MGSDDAKPEPFEWPPTRLSDAELNAPARPLGAGGRYRIESRSREAIDDDAGFDAGSQLSIEWDEPEYDLADNVAADEGGQRVHPEPDGAPVRGVARWLEAFEIAYLGRVSASWDVRARDAGWRADDSGDYCPRCGLTVGAFALDTLTDPPTCPACRDRKLPWDRFVRLGAYEGVLASAVRELKFHAMRAHGEKLGALLGQRLSTSLGALNVATRDAAIVPVPMTPWRRISRGVDHAATIARSAGKAAGVPVVRALWRRHRPAQWSVPTSERRRNVSGSFGVWRWWPGLGSAAIRRLRRCRAVIVMDDVRTTGATMSEACRSLDRALWAGKGGCSPIIIASTVAVANIRMKS